jgi:hypothetical protein
MKLEYKRIEEGKLLKYDIITYCSESEISTDVVSKDEDKVSNFRGFTAVRPHIELTVNELLKLIEDYEKNREDYNAEQFLRNRISGLET